MNTFRVSSFEVRVTRSKVEHPQWLALLSNPKPETRNPRHGLHSERGLALMVALWLLAFLGVIFMTFAFSMRTELAAAGNFRQGAEAYHLAEAGVYRAAAELINAEGSIPPPGFTPYDYLMERWRGNPDIHENVLLGRGSYSVTIIDEESKIPLNGATDAMLARLLSNSGVTDEKLVSTIVDSIQDWRDPDNLHRMNGAEDDYYLSLPTPYRAKNADFEVIDELLLVKGMTPEILYGNIGSPERRAELEAQFPWERQLEPGEFLGIAKNLSVSGSGRVNVKTANGDVLMALGLTAMEAQAVIERRTQGPVNNLGEITALLTSISGGGRKGFEIVKGGQPGSASSAQVLASLPRVATVASITFYVESTGRVAGSRLTSRIGAILRNVGPRGRPKIAIRLWSLDPRQGG